MYVCALRPKLKFTAIGATNALIDRCAPVTGTL